MITVNFYKDSNNLWHFNGMIIPPGTIVINEISSTEIGFSWLNKNLGKIFQKPILITNVLKENGTGYSNIAEFQLAVKDFFVKATSEVATDVYTINETDALLSGKSNTGHTHSTFSSESLTYSSLFNLTQISGLTIGQKYIITDYQTVHTISNTFDINYGLIEPLLIVALTTSKLSNYCFSTIYQQDIIYYDINSDQAMQPGCTKGYIYRRIDTIKNNDIGFDYRNVKFRRWTINVTNQHINGDSPDYTKGSVIKKTGTNEIYIKLNDVQSGFNTSSWKLFEWYNGSYIIPQYGDWYIVDDVITIILPVGDLYKDCYLFTVDSFTDNVVQSTDSIYNNRFIGNNIDIIDNSSNVFFGSDHNNNTIGSNFNNNTIGYSFIGNIIGYEFNYNSVGHSFSGNIVGNATSYNTFGIDFIDNIIGSRMYYNTIGDSCQYNNIENDFGNNILGYGFNHNIIGNTFNAAGGCDFSLSSYVYLTFDKQLFSNSNSVKYLKFYDSNNILQIIPANE